MIWQSIYKKGEEMGFIMMKLLFRKLRNILIETAIESDTG